MVQLKSLIDCELAIGGYPRFKYDATGGGGVGQVSTNDQGEHEKITFDTNTLLIPPLNTKSTKVLGLPLPPYLEISVKTKKLCGEINRLNGKVNLQFEALFCFSIGNLIKAPDLIVKTNLTTGEARSSRHSVKGKLVSPEGVATLVGIANVAPTGNTILDKFLGLPDEALAILNCQFLYENSFNEP
ncbi:hypothetical protein [Prochlorococcus sp. MIT 1300]|uniref:hypothetical protein n=1 Tax=Prochlorococcus sp. MIT 1300 TaxID=3096218 RepID=UPI002A7618AB|nr:hypothetical protein [Prochlorococcus sp. MIT 1300]